MWCFPRKVRTGGGGGDLRKAVLRRDEEWRINSCDDHIDEIHQSNLSRLYWYHHHLIHHENWTLTGNANDFLTLTNTTSGQTWTNRRPPKRGP